MQLKTQIGGKYDPSNTTLFDLKKHLQRMGISVTHPLADQMVSSVNGQGYAFDITKVSFYDVEKDYYNSIRTCTFHIVNNQFMENKGYLGQSASLEIAYAIVYERPIILLFPMCFAPSANTFIIGVLKQNKHLFEVNNLLECKLEDNLNFFHNLKNKKIKYCVTEREKKEILRQVEQLFTSLKKST